MIKDHFRTGLRSDIFRHSLLLVLSALLFAASFPGFLFEKGFRLAGFVAAAPLFYVMLNTRKRAVPYYGLLFSFCYSFFQFYWLANFNNYSIWVVVIFLWVYFCIMFLLMSFVAGVLENLWFIAFPVFWTFFEFLRTVGFLGYPYGLLGYSQYSAPFLRQAASITGVFGISFSLYLFSALIVLLFAHYQSVRSRISDVSFGEKIKFFFEGKVIKVQLSVGIFVIILFMVVMPALGALSIPETSSNDETLKIMLVQHNAEAWEGGFKRYKKNFSLLRSLTEDSLKKLESEFTPQLIVWPETAFVPGYWWYMNFETNWDGVLLVDEFNRFVQKLPCAFITGNSDGRLNDPDEPCLLSDGSLNRKDYNAALFFKKGRLIDVYRKQRLVPFSEHFPLLQNNEKFQKFVKKNDLRYWEKGGECNIFKLDGKSLAANICYEDVFDDICRKFTLKGADVLVNITNDMWADSVESQRYHQMFAVFRSIENRRPMVRAANSGMTCLILPDGRIVAELDPCKSSVLNVEVPLQSETKLTFFTKAGSWFSVLSGGLSCVFICLALFMKVYKFIKKN